MKHPYLLNMFLLTIALVLSVAIGAVFISPGTIMRIIIESATFQFDPGDVPAQGGTVGTPHVEES